MTTPDPYGRPPGWDPLARDEWGAPLTAAELCDRESCHHEWLSHDHAYAPLGSAEFGRCFARGPDGGRCRCLAFYPRPVNRPPDIAPPPLYPPPPEPEWGRPVTVPPPPAPIAVVPAPRHAAPATEPPTVPTTVPIPYQERTAPLGRPAPPR